MNVIKYIRDSDNITQERLSDLFGISVRQIRNWENEYVLPKKIVVLACLMMQEFSEKEILKIESMAENFEYKGD